MDTRTNNGWQEVRSANGRLLFLLNRQKNLIEQKVGSTIHVIDLDDGSVSERPASAYKRPRIRNLGHLAY